MKRLLALLAGLLGTGPAAACGLELVLAVDVSRSVINTEYTLQIRGLANAFRDPDIIRAIGWVPGGVAVTLSQWSGPRSQSQTIDWRLLTGPKSVRAFAEAIDNDQRRFFAAYTAIGEALFHANSLSATNPYRCARRVIDISGDGVSNRGRAPRPIADALAANGVTINALVIEGARPDPLAHYRAEVIAGAGAFVEPARSFDDYARAIRQKLLRELSPSLARR